MITHPVFIPTLEGDVSRPVGCPVPMQIMEILPVGYIVIIQGTAGESATYFIIQLYKKMGHYFTSLTSHFQKSFSLPFTIGHEPVNKSGVAI
jgi:hypothetical protein